MSGRHFTPEEIKRVLDDLQGLAVIVPLDPVMVSLVVILGESALKGFANYTLEEEQAAKDLLSMGLRHLKLNYDKSVQEGRILPVTN